MIKERLALVKDKKTGDLGCLFLDQYHGIEQLYYSPKVCLFIQEGHSSYTYEYASKDLTLKLTKEEQEQILNFLKNICEYNLNQYRLIKRKW